LRLLWFVVLLRAAGLGGTQKNKKEENEIVSCAPAAHHDVFAHVCPRVVHVRPFRVSCRLVSPAVLILDGVLFGRSLD